MPRAYQPRHDPHSNRFLLLSIFVFATVLVYLTTHRPSSSSRASTSSSPPLKSKQSAPSTPQNSLQRPLVPPLGTQQVIQHRIVAIGDIHGDFAALTKILRKARLIDLKGQWIGGSTILVQTGDIVDRGVDTIACYKFMQGLRPLAKTSGGALISLLGNHEIMNALGDWRYVSSQDIKSFGGERNRRHALSSEGWIGKEWRSNYSITARVPFLTREFPSTNSVVQFPSTPRGQSDQRFLSEPRTITNDDDDEEASTLDRDGAISFVHGGITPEYLETLPRTPSLIEQMNRIGRSVLRSLDSDQTPYPISLPPGSSREQKLFWSEHGPMWNRDWALLEEGEICARVDQVLEKLRVRRLVMGHTPHFEGILSRCRGKVLLIDTGISRAYGGAHSFLEITHTLTPASLVSSREISLQDDDDRGDVYYNEVREIEGNQGEEEGEEGKRRWIEHEIVKAVYEQREDGRDGEEILVDFKRLLTIR